MSESGYRPCQCRGCMEIAIGEPGAYCWECEEANCRDYQETEGMSNECQVERLTEEKGAVAYVKRPQRKWYDLDKGKTSERCVAAQIWPGQRKAETQDLDGNDETVSTDRLSEIES